jgi:vitamin B12 transporter
MKQPRTIFTPTLLLALILVMFTGIATAQDSSQPSQSGDEMVVTATRTQERPIDVPVNTEVISREKIEMSGAVNVGDLIGKYITGHLHKYSGLLTPVGMRGFRSESHGDDIKGYVLILIDGHRIGTGNAAKISVDRIERIEVTKGPASALYGSAAMGGVINLITKKGDGDFSASLGAEYGSFDYIKGLAEAGGEVNDRFRFHAAVSYEDMDDFDDPEFGTVYNSDETKTNFGGNLVWAISPAHELRLGGNYADLTGGYPSWAMYTTYGAYDEATAQNFDKSHSYADLEYNGDYFDGKVRWRGLAYYIKDRNQWNYGSPNPDDEQSKYTDETLGTDHQFVWQCASWNTLLLGFNMESLEKESEGVSGGLPAAPYTPGMEYDSQALFIQDSLDLMDNRVNIIAAARYDRFDLKTVHPKTGNLPGFVEKSEDYDNISPKLGIGVKFLDDLLRVRANVGEGFKSPSADQLSADYVNSFGLRYVGNPDLDPEKSLTYDVGADFFHEVFTVKIGYWHTDYEDKIVSTSILADGMPASSWDNHGDAEVAGFDLNLEWYMGRMLDWPLDVTLWSNATVNSTKEDGETGEDLLYISDYEIKSGLDVTYQGLSGQLSYVVVGPQMITNYDGYPYVEEEKSSFDIWDLTLRYRFLDHWDVRASVLNLFDERIEWVRGHVMPERNYRVGVTYTF